MTPALKKCVVKRGRQKFKLLIIADYNAGNGAEGKGYITWAAVQGIPGRDGS